MSDDLCPNKETHDRDSILLERFKSSSAKIHFLSYAGGGRAGHVFKVSIDQTQYALKIKKFKFDHPELNPSRLTGTHRKYFLDPFFIECRANGSLIQRGLNGLVTPTCYGWVTLSTGIERYLMGKFEISSYTWNRPPSAKEQKLQGILFEWVDGKPLSEIAISSGIADRVREKLNALHDAGIAHNDLAASNILIEGLGSNSNAYLLDLSASITLPHIKFSSQRLKEIQQEELQHLEVGFAWLSRIPINQGVCVANLSSSGAASLDQIFAESHDIKHLWAPPQPTCWQPTALKQNPIT